MQKNERTNGKITLIRKKMKQIKHENFISYVKNEKNLKNGRSNTEE